MRFALEVAEHEPEGVSEIESKSNGCGDAAPVCFLYFSADDEVCRLSGASGSLSRLCVAVLFWIRASFSSNIFRSVLHSLSDYGIMRAEYVFETVETNY